MGAVTIANKVQGNVGSRRNVQREVQCDVTLSASYATGGDTVAIGSLGLKRVDAISQDSRDLNTRKPVATAATRSGVSIELGGTPTAPTIKVYDALATEVAAASSNAARGPLRITFIGV